MLANHGRTLANHGRTLANHGNVITAFKIRLWQVFHMNMEEVKIEKRYITQK